MLTLLIIYKGEIAMARSVRVLPLILFAVLACLLGWAQHLASALGAKISPENIPLGPLLAAAITAVLLGRSELKTWWRQLLNFRASAGWYILSLVAPAAIIVAVKAVISAASPGD